jgi:uncharacterized repeat protein (TIGR01451 family)
MTFKVPMRIPATAQGGQIAWNSFAQRVTNATPTGGRLTTSEPRKVGIIVPKRMSIGNRVWIDANDSGTVDGPDGANPGVANVKVSLYQDANNDGAPDGAAIAIDTTDANGYYLFGDLTPGSYIVGIDNTNWQPGQPLENYISSIGNATNNNDRNDNGIDSTTLLANGVKSNTITLTVDNAPTGETELSGNPNDGPFSRGVRGETDNNSNLTVDFGFFIPMSIGNRVWLDEGAGGGTRNNGNREAGEPGIAGVTVNLFADANNDGIADGPAIKTTLTDGNGYYLFDALTQGRYIVGIPAANFTGPLANMASSHPFNGADNQVDDDDNGRDNPAFATAGIFSSTVTLMLNVEPTGEVDRGPQGPQGFGNNTELDLNSDLTIDFGFYIPKISLGNRVWLDMGGGNVTLGNNALRDAGEPGIANVTVSLYRDNNNDGVPDGAAIANTTTDGNGYYLFDNLSAGRYIVGLDNNNFAPLQPLNGLISSTGSPGSDALDNRDNANDVIDPVFGLYSRSVLLAIQQEPTGEADLSGNPAHGPGSIGNQGQFDFDSNLTVDFGLYRPMSIGNRVWLDDGAGGGIPRNGIQEGGEAGIPNVIVRLYADNGDGVFNPAVDTQVRTDITDGNGFYLFDNILEGNYFVWIDRVNFQAGGVLANDDTVPGFADTTGFDRNDHGNDENFPATNGVVSKIINLTANTQPTGEADLSGNPADGPNSRGTHNEADDNSNLAIDFGFAPTILSVGNRVWFDINNSRIIDAPDGATPGLANVIVHLYADADNNGVPDGAALQTKMTDGNGYYLFDNLTAGRYIVGLDELNFRAGGVLVDLYSSTGTAVQPDQVDSDDKGVDNANPQVGGIRSRSFLLAKNGAPTGETVSGNPADGPSGWGNQGQLDSNSNLTIDFGLYKPMSIGNRVWFDIDNSGTINGTETGIPGVTVEIYAAVGGNPTGAALQTKVTDANGYYLFDNLTPGDYVVVVAAANFNAGGPLNGMSSSTGADASTTIDSNDNGIDVAVAQGIRSNTITLALNSEPTGEADFSGNAANDGPNFIGRNGETNNNSNLTVDFGFTAGQMSLGNRVWLDRNNSAQQNAGEPGIANVKVSLYRDANSDGIPDGAAIKTTTTDGTGYYLFTQLTPGNYLVGLDNANFNAGQPLNGLISSTGVLAGDTNDHGIDVPNVTYGILSNNVTLTLNGAPTGETDLGTLGSGGAADNNSDLTIDFGLHRPQSIGNRVWFDTNNDGLMNGIEGGIAGVTVGLYADANNDGVPDGPALGTTITDANGYYLFDGLGDGRFLVRVEPANFQPGGVLENLNSSTGNATNNTDRNDNGIDNATLAANGILSNTITLTQNTSPTGETDLGPQGRGTHGETDNNSNLTVDFGFTGGSMSLGNRVWIDDGVGGGTPRDGIRNGAELGIANVRVSLYRDANADGAPDGPALGTKTTDANGYYLFDKLAAGQYVVQILPTNFNTGAPLFGYGSTLTGPADVDNNDNGVDSNNPAATGIFSRTVILQTGTEPTGETDPTPQVTGGATDDNSNLTVDFGFYKAMSLGNRVWFDPNDNGLLETGEIGIPGVTVTLFRDNGDGVFGAGDTPAGTDTTDSRGYYLFDDLFLGNYFVQVDATNFQGANVLVGFKSSTGVQAGNADKTDKGIDDPTPQTNGILSAMITLTPNTAPTGETDTSGDVTDGPFFRGNHGQSDNNSNLTIDFGFNAPAMSLGNRVWLDDGTGGGTADNGIREANEPPLANVTIGLYADVNKDGVPDGAAIATTTTDANGYYLFDGLVPGSYVVRIEPPNFQNGGPLFGLSSSAGAIGTQDDHDNGIDAANTAANGILSASITLTSNAATTGETDLGPQGNGAGGITDNNANLTADFGFHVSYDMGDVPDTFGTTNAATGAKHRIISNLYLGTLEDADADGQPNPTATGDDAAGAAPDDEDGVKVPVFVVGTTQNVEVTVFNNTGTPATVAVWVDFNGNGVFDAGERFAATVPSAATAQVIQIPVIVPIGADVATGGNTYLRTRLSTDAAAVNNPTGTANDGEVEDYVATVTPPGMSITKTNSQNSIVAGQATTYTITITNSGVDVLNHNVVDNIPTGSPNGFDPATVTWTCVSQNGASCIAGQPAGTGANGTGAINQFIDIPRNSTVIYTMTGTLNPNYNQPTVTNTASLVPGQSAQDVDGVITDPPAGVKSGVLVGSNVIHWTMTWLNTGAPQAATVTDPIPANQTFIGNLTCTPFGTTTTTSCMFNAGTITWSGTLGTGTANRLEIGFDVQVPGNGSYQNVASINIGGQTSAATGTVNVGGPAGGGTPVPNLANPAIIKSVDTTIAGPGSDVTWTIMVSNPNPVALTNVQVSDTLPAQLEIISVSTPVGAATVSGSAVNITIPTLNPGQTANIIVHSRVRKDAQGGQIENVAILIGPYKGQSSAILNIVQVLPKTGEHPDPTPAPPYGLLVGGIAVVGLLVWSWRRIVKR